MEGDPAPAFDLSLLLLFLGIVGAVAVSNLWLRRRARREGEAKPDPGSEDSR